MPTDQTRRTTSALSRNADYPWDELDPARYFDQNYRTMHQDDRRILELVRDFFAVEVGRPLGRGIDVGSGPNLYPALAMMPFCDEITLLEYGAANCRWLTQEIARFPQSWRTFWDILAQEPIYAKLDNPKQLLRERAKVQRGDLFHLGPQQWNVGTMFFVAESITPGWQEFQLAVERFIRALRPGAPFAAAFMEKSSGYKIGQHEFPAVAVTEPDIEQCLRQLGCDASLVTVRSDVPFRKGYDGMILALGWTGEPKT